MSQRHYDLRNRDTGTGIGQRQLGVIDEYVYLAGKALNTASLQHKGLDDTHAIDSFRQILVHAIVGRTDGTIQLYQVIGLARKDSDANKCKQQRHQSQQEVIPAQQTDGRTDHQ
ncbi:hypothetical protein D3C81_1264750 [compost metagenome]